MVESHNIDGPDQAADLANPVSQKMHQAAERMLVEFPIDLHLSLDRNADPRFERSCVELMERTIAAIASVAAKIHGTIKVTPVVLKLIENRILFGKLPKDLTQVEAQPYYEEDENWISVLVTMRHVLGMISCFEVRIDLE